MDEVDLFRGFCSVGVFGRVLVYVCVCMGRAFLSACLCLFINLPLSFSNAPFLRFSVRDTTTKIEDRGEYIMKKLSSIV